ncbi:thioredoxin domain-containing protein [Cohnella sp. WQ 127256]|uniref:thioredoxin domain-containing protein n=1 Tax=Cohnella sp. WQ 127256 TaxID=2938790 RepID=UPI0021178255|nr:thioredoxin domain-containing protein [Cohnella sp. WQ 127256]
MSKSGNKRKSVSTQKKNPGKTLVLYTGIFIVLLVAIFLINKASTDKEQDLTRVSELPSIVNQPVIGNADAKVTLIEFGDYKCPSCKKWTQTVYPELKEQYIDTGKLKMVYINTLFHGAESQLGAIAGEAVLAQNVDAFWSFNKAMFEAQPTANHDVAWITEEKIMELAKTITPAIDLQQLQNDIKNKITLPEVEIDNKLIDKYRINQTPTVMINGIIIENPFDMNTIKSVLEQELVG